MLHALQSQLPACARVCVVNNASDAWDISDRGSCASLVDRNDIFASAYRTSGPGAMCQNHAHWNGNASVNSFQDDPVLTGTLR